MIYITDETVFNVNADCIVNTVNCVGVMGKGLALEFALRYPKLNDLYIEQCEKRLVKTGNVYFYEINGDKIINFPTKYNFKFPSRYEWIESGLIDFISKYKSLNIKSIAFPLLGCTNGELDKNIVLSMMMKYLDLEDLTVYICKSTKLNGKEKEMVENFKNTSISKLTNIAKLNKLQVEIIKDNQDKIDRFYKILDLEKIGKTSYSKLFNYFYNYKEKKEDIQLSLFD